RRCVNWLWDRYDKSENCSLNRSGAPGQVDGHDSGLGFLAYFHRRMEQLRKNFEAGDQAGAWTGEKAVGVERIHTASANGGNVLPACGKTHRAIFVARLARSVTARSDDQDVRLSGNDIIGTHAK